MPYSSQIVDINSEKEGAVVDKVSTFMVVRIVKSLVFAIELKTIY